MKHLVEHLSAAVMTVAWLAGLVLVKGFWPTAAAIFFPPYAWYVLMQKLLEVA